VICMVTVIIQDTYTFIGCVLGLLLSIGLMVENHFLRKKVIEDG